MTIACIVLFGFPIAFMFAKPFDDKIPALQILVYEQKTPFWVSLFLDFSSVNYRFSKIVFIIIVFSQLA